MKPPRAAAVALKPGQTLPPTAAGPAGLARTRGMGNRLRVDGVKARYFPVLPSPLRMMAGLNRFGCDFGQGARDQQFFQLDGERAHYLAAKRQAPAERRVLGDEQGAAAARAAALAWMRETLAREAPHVLEECARDHAAADELDALARALQEDFCVMCAGADFEGSAALIDVRFPTGWRPERQRDASFQAIHGPVPGFAKHESAAKSMIRSMVERGPFVRFVWTLCPDQQLDRHPDRPRQRWEDACSAWLRVERQVTVPLPGARASVFLIRVYHYGLAELTPDQHRCVVSALECMPEDIRVYKALPQATRVAELLPRVSSR